MNDSLFNYETDSLVSYLDRCKKLGQKGLVVWFTGLSGAGKTTIAHAVEKRLFDQGRFVFNLDGDRLRMGLNANLSFSYEDRKENIRRVAEVAKLFHQAGMIILASFISPQREMREFARSILPSDAFIEVYVKASLATCIERDPKGYYKKSMSGEIKDYTGISQVYEEPLSPDLLLDTEILSLEECISRVQHMIDIFQQNEGEAKSPDEPARYT